MDTHEDLLAALATQIKVELAGRSMNQKDLAAAIGIESATLSRYMTGKKFMPMLTFIAVANTLGLSPATLMERAEARIA